MNRFDIGARRKETRKLGAACDRYAEFLGVKVGVVETPAWEPAR
jgi:hypothetical protein